MLQPRLHIAQTFGSVHQRQGQHQSLWWSTLQPGKSHLWPLYLYWPNFIKSTFVCVCIVSIDQLSWKQLYGCQYSRIIDHSNLKYHIFKLNFLQIYKQYLDLLFTVIVPLMGLIIFNLRIFLAIRKNRNRWDLDNISSSKTILQLINFSSIRSTRTEITLAKVVLSIVFIFVVCQIPRIYLAFYRVSEKYTTNIKYDQASSIKWQIISTESKAKSNSSIHVFQPMQWTFCFTIFPSQYPRVVSCCSRACRGGRTCAGAWGCCRRTPAGCSPWPRCSTSLSSSTAPSTSSSTAPWAPSAQHWIPHYLLNMQISYLKEGRTKWQNAMQEKNPV